MQIHSPKGLHNYFKEFDYFINSMSPIVEEPVVISVLHICLFSGTPAQWPYVWHPCASVMDQLEEGLFCLSWPHNRGVE